MLRNKLRLLIIVGVALLLIFLGVEYKSVPISNRAFVLGMGIDYADGSYELTTEILVPINSSGGGSDKEGSHKMLTGRGTDVAHALNDIFKKTGRLPSLGHCSILILGENVYKREILRELEFFIKSDSFRASTNVAVTEGTAKDLMNTKTPLENFTSLSLFDIISVYGKNTNTSVTTLGDFKSNMLSPSASSYLTLVKTVPSSDTSAGSGANNTAGAADEPLVFYDCSSVAAFRGGSFAGFLSSDETDGMRLLQNQNHYDSFRVQNENGDFSTVVLTSKIVKTRISLGTSPETVYELKVKIKPVEAEELNTVEGFVVSSEITDKMRESVKEQISEKIKTATDKFSTLGSDFLFLGNKFYSRYGKKWDMYTAANPDNLSKIKITVKITVN